MRDFWDPYAGFVKTTLPNGLDIHCLYMPDRPVVAMGFIIHSGSRIDPPGKEGLMHFLEHLVSRNVPGLSCRQIDDFFCKYGGGCGLGTTGYMFTRYQFILPPKERIVAEGLSIFGKMLLASNIQNEVEVQRKVVTQEFNRDHQLEVVNNIKLQTRVSLYGKDHYLARSLDPLGLPSSIAAIHQEDLWDHFNRQYTPRNMSVIYVGGMKPDMIIRLIEKSPFAMEKDGQRTPLPKKKRRIDPPNEKRIDIIISNYIKMDKPLEVGSLEIKSVIPGSFGHGTISILQAMLSQSLFEEIRESKGWTYSIGCSWENLYEFYDFSIGCSSLSKDALDSISDIIDEIIASIERNSSLFSETKQQLIADKRLNDLRCADIRKNALMGLLNRNRVTTLGEEIESLRRTSLNDIRRLLEFLGSERRVTMLMRP